MECLLRVMNLVSGLEIFNFHTPVSVERNNGTVAFPARDARPSWWRLVRVDSLSECFVLSKKINLSKNCRTWFTKNAAAK